MANIKISEEAAQEIAEIGAEVFNACRVGCPTQIKKAVAEGEVHQRIKAAIDVAYADLAAVIDHFQRTDAEHRN